MTQTSNRLFDELARLMTDAANVAQGVRREASTAFRSQADRLITDLDLVRREDFDAVKEMASRARAENERLAERVAALEAELGALSGKARKPAEEEAATAEETAAKPKRAPRNAKPATE
jgi:BMFP domain-containing protein YqiC